MYVTCPGTAGKGHIPTILRAQVGPHKDSGDSGGSMSGARKVEVWKFYRILRVLEALRGSCARILRVREAPGRDTFLPL